MWIRVTQLDINRGTQQSSEQCPIARATRRALNWNKTVAVGFDSLTVKPATDTGTGREQYVVLPGRASDFISAFDLDRDIVEPFAFQIPAVRPFARGPVGW